MNVSRETFRKLEGQGQAWPLSQVLLSKQVVKLL
jgi:hypothetical protein